MNSRCIKFFIKKNPASWDSPPAAGRFSDTILFRRSAILAERFLLYRNLLYNKKSTGISTGAHISESSNITKNEINISASGTDKPI